MPSRAEGGEVAGVLAAIIVAALGCNCNHRFQRSSTGNGGGSSSSSSSRRKRGKSRSGTPTAATGTAATPDPTASTATALPTPTPTPASTPPITATTLMASLPTHLYTSPPWFPPYPELRTSEDSKTKLRLIKGELRGWRVVGEP